MTTLLRWTHLLPLLLPLVLCPAFACATVLPGPFPSQAVTVLPAGANLSSPTNINLATSFPLSGAYADHGPQTSQAFFLWLQLVNKRGGIVLNGTRYNFTLTYLDDCSSAGYIQTVFSNYVSALNSQGQPLYQIIHTPTTSALSAPAVQAIALTSSSPRPTFTTYAASPALYSGAYPSVYGNIEVSSLWLNKTLTTIMDYIPLRTVSIYYRLDAFVSSMLPPLLLWIQQNGLTLLQNVALNFPATGVEGAAMAALMQSTINGSETADLFVMAVTAYTDAESACEAFQQLQYSPKSALYLSAFADSTYFSQCDQWVSLNPWGPSLNFSSSLPDYVFSNSYQLQPLLQAAYGISLSSYHVATAAQLDLMLSALSVAQSTDPALVHAAMQQLTGNSVLGAFQLEPVKQYNALGQIFPFQLREGANHLLVQPADLLFPAQWAWVKVLPGDSLTITWTASLIVLAVVLCVFGAWISVLLLEQTLVLLAQKKWRLYWMWLCLASGSLGGGAIWTCATILCASLSINCPSCVADTSIDYSLPVVFLALLPALVLTFLSLLTMTSRIHCRRSPGSGAERKEDSASTDDHGADQVLAALRVGQEGWAGATSSTRSSMPRSSVQPVDSKGKARDRQQPPSRVQGSNFPLSLQGQYLRMLAPNAHILLAAVFLAGAVIAVRAVLILVFVTNASFSASRGAQVVSIVFVFVLCLCTLYAVFFARTLRLIGVFTMMTAVVLDFVYQSNFYTARYEPGYAHAPPSLYTGGAVSGTVLTLLMAIVGAVLGIALIALQFKKMALSQRSNMLTLMRMKKEVRSAKRDTAQQVKQTEVMAQIAGEFARVLEAINISRPHTDGAKQLALLGCLANTPSPLDNQLATSARDLYPLLRKTGGAVAAPNAELSSPEMSAPISWLSGRGLQTPLALPTGGSAVCALAIAAQSLFTATTSYSQSSPAEQEEALEALMEQVESTVKSRESAGHRDSATEEGVINPASLGMSSHSSPWNDEALMSVVKAAGERALAVTKWRPTLSQLLSHPLTVELLKDELLRLHCAENVMFLLAVRRFEKVTHCHSLQRRLARHILDEFVREGAPQQVNIDQKLRSAIISNYDKGDQSSKKGEDLFAVARREVEMLLETNNMKAFQSSPSYITATYILARNSMLMTSFSESLTGFHCCQDLDEPDTAGHAESRTDQGNLSRGLQNDGVAAGSTPLRRKQVSSANSHSGRGSVGLQQNSTATSLATAVTNVVAPIESDVEMESIH